ncbi:MAG: hydroxyacid dehydrogenase [Alistipes sp.]|nr:hydroxyacid dehydrogenase [Candidatus Alistipes equi]
MKIVFLDEYSMAGACLDSIMQLGEYQGYDRTKAEDVVERSKDADVIISNKVYISAKTMDQLPKLKLIAVAATGMNNVDLDAAKARGIEVKNAKGYSTSSVAEHTLGMALALRRDLVYYDKYIKDGQYAASADIFHFGRSIRDIKGCTWGIIGLGVIGHEVARLAEAFGCNVVYSSTSGIERKEKYKCLALNELLSQSDIVSIHCPLNQKTNGLIGYKEMLLMKKESIIINVARGGIVIEEDLCRILNEKRIAAAALDVFSEEPLHNSPIYNIEDKYSTILSPHNAWASEKSMNRLILTISNNISEFIAQSK